MGAKTAFEAKAEVLRQGTAALTLSPVPLNWLTPGRFAFLLLALLVAAFPKVLVGLETFYYRDYGVLAYPVVFHEHENFWRGEFPFWNGLSNCGAPLMAQWGSMTLYPFSLIYLVFPLPWSLTFFCFGHLVLGGLGMYLLCYRWTESRAGAAVAGVAYVFNGLTFSCLSWPNYTVALGWMPWVVMTAESAWSRGGRSIVIAAATAALQLLSGVPEMVILTWVAVGALCILALTRAEERGRLFLRLVGVISLAAGLTAVQLLPFFDLLLHSHRDRSFLVSKWAMPAWGWANFLVPLFHCFQNFQGLFFQHEQEFFTSYYLGAGVLVLAAWAIWKSGDRRVWLLGVLVLIASLLALGKNGFLFPLVHHWLPLVGIARYPIKFLLLAGFAVPLMCGFAMRRLETPAEEQRPVSLTVMFGAAALLILVILCAARFHALPYDQWPATFHNGIVRLLLLTQTAAAAVLFARSTTTKMRNALAGAILMIIFADAFTHTVQQNPSLPTHVVAGGLWQAQGKMPAPEPGKSRVFITPQAEQHLIRDTIRDPNAEFLGQRLALWSNLNLLDQIPKVNGSSTLQIREQMQLQKRLYDQTNRLPEGLLDFLCVSHVTSASNLVEWTPRTNFCSFVTAGQKPEFVDDATAMRRLMENSFDPRKTVFLPADLRSTISVRDAADVHTSEPSITTHGLKFRTTAAGPALCLIAQSFYHCWKPSVDGKPVPLLRANGAFQAIAIPGGTHEISIIYRDYCFWAGLAISLATICSCVLIWRRALNQHIESGNAKIVEGLFGSDAEQPAVGANKGLAV